MSSPTRLRPRDNSAVYISMTDLSSDPSKRSESPEMQPLVDQPGVPRGPQFRVRAREPWQFPVPRDGTPCPRLLAVPTLPSVHRCVRFWSWLRRSRVPAAAAGAGVLTSSFRVTFAVPPRVPRRRQQPTARHRSSKRSAEYAAAAPGKQWGRQAD